MRAAAARRRGEGGGPGSRGAAGLRVVIRRRPSSEAARVGAGRRGPSAGVWRRGGRAPSATRLSHLFLVSLLPREQHVRGSPRGSLRGGAEGECARGAREARVAPAGARAWRAACPRGGRASTSAVEAGRSRVGPPQALWEVAGGSLNIPCVPNRAFFNAAVCRGCS